MDKIGKLGESKKDLLSVIFLIALCFLFFIKLFLPQASFFVTPDLGHSDILYGNVPRDYLFSESLKERKIPLWTSQKGTGLSLIEEGQFVKYNIVNLFLYYLFPSIAAFGFEYIFFLSVGTTGLYLLARFLNFERQSAIFSAVCFATSGFFIFRITHTSLFGAFALVPFVYLFTFRIYKQGKIVDILLLSFFVAQQIFTGHPQVVVIEMLSLAISLIYLWIKNKDEWGKSVKRLLLVGGALFFGVILTSIQIFPFLEFKNESTRSGGISFDTVTSESISLKSLPTLIYPFAFGSPVNTSYKLYKDGKFDVFWEKMGYVGLVPFIFVFIGLFIKKNSKPIFFGLFTLVAIFGLLLALGKNGPLFFLYHLPPFSYFRGPGRSLFLVDFATSILAGYGLQWFLEKMKERNVRLNIATFLVLLISLTYIPSFLIVYYYHPTVETQKILNPPESYKYIRESTDRVYTLGSGAPYMKHLLEAGWEDYDFYLYQMNSLEANLSLLYGFSGTGVYAGARTKRQDFLQTLLANSAIGDLASYNATATPLHKKLLDITNTRFLISPFKITDADLPLRHTVEPPNKSWQPFFVYENLNVLPRARIVSDYIRSANLDESEKLLNSDDFDFNKSIIENDFSKKLEKANGQATIVKDDQEKLYIDAKSDKDGILLLADTYYPGWKAYVDGQETKIYPANVNQRAIEFPKGEHKVEFVYDPESFKIGKTISLISFSVWGLLLMLILIFKRNLRVA